MTARRRLSVLLGLLALPLVLEATNGCDVVFDLERVPLNDNALQCDCRCEESGSRTRMIVVATATTSNDAEQTGQTMDLFSPDLDLGERIVGLRFTDVKIPPFAKINSAYVQFTADATENVTTSLDIRIEANKAAAAFTTTDNDLSARGTGNGVQWDPPAWTLDEANDNERTPELAGILQEVIDLVDWTNDSSIVVRIRGFTGRRTAESFDGDPANAPVLVIDYTAEIGAVIPACAPDAVRASDGSITAASAITECVRVEKTFRGMAEQCGYPTSCECDVVDVPDQDDSTHSDVCEEPCEPMPVDDMCTNFNPVRLAECLEAHALNCDVNVSATNAGDDLPVCVDSGSPLAFHMFGRRSQCDLTGTTDIQVGDREPKQAPATDGTVQILGGPCPGGGCSVYPYFDLRMAPITFSIKWHSDPTFYGLSATGRARDGAVLDGVEATFLDDTVEGAGNGRRGSDGLAFFAMNADPLHIAVDWAAKRCDMTGNLVAGVNGEAPDGLCEDDETPCNADSPDCDGIGGGTCVLFEEEDDEQMNVDVYLTEGTLVNQPPTADAGPEIQTIECTSAAGAGFLLDGRASSDPDLNLALASWHQGSRNGPVVSDDLIAGGTLGVGAAETFVLRVIDTYAQTDEDATSVAVVDTTPPVIACNAPSTLRPPSSPVSFTATATDVCDASVTAEVVAFDCFKIAGNGMLIDKRSSCGVSFAGGTITIRNKGGDGDHIQWTVRATDDTGNVKEVVCGTLIQS